MKRRRRKKQPRLADVVSLAQHKLDRALPDLQTVTELLEKHGLADGAPVYVDRAGEMWCLTFGRVADQTQFKRRRRR